MDQWRTDSRVFGTADSESSVKTWFFIIENRVNTVKKGWNPVIWQFWTVFRFLTIHRSIKNGFLGFQGCWFRIRRRKLIFHHWKQWKRTKKPAFWQFWTYFGFNVGEYSIRMWISQPLLNHSRVCKTQPVLVLFWAKTRHFQDFWSRKPENN